MRRSANLAEEPKSKKANVGEDSDGEMSDSMEADNADMDEVLSGTSENGIETSSRPAKKRSSRGGHAKAVEEDDDDDTEEEVKQENGKSPIKKRKKDDSDGGDSESKTEKPVSKKKKENGQKAKGNKKTPAKSGKKDKIAKKKAETNEVDKEEEDEYEVEKVIAMRTIKGMRQFRVRWKGYSQEDDTWEKEKELNCKELIEEFLAEQENEKSADKEVKGKDKQEPKKKGKKKTAVKKSSEGKNVAPADAENEDDADDSKEFEVGKIIDVHFGKDKKRSFLIRWQGFSSKDDSWEPEDQLNCPELISKFMKNLEKIKSLDSRELRANRVHTNRYTLTMYGDKRQSRRNVNKERKTYYECD